MLACGIDVGSRNVSAVIIDDEAILAHYIITSAEEGSSIARRVVNEAVARTKYKFDDIQYIVVTGCGRNSVPFANRTGENFRVYKSAAADHFYIIKDFSFI